MVVASFRDISERLEAQAQQERLRREADHDRETYERRLQQSERLESLGRLDALEPGVDLLEKPFAQTTLLRRVRRAVDTAGEPAGPPSAGR